MVHPVTPVGYEVILLRGGGKKKRRIGARNFTYLCVHDLDKYNCSECHGSRLCEVRPFVLATPVNHHHHDPAWRSLPTRPEAAKESATPGAINAYLQLTPPPPRARVRYSTENEGHDARSVRKVPTARCRIITSFITRHLTAPPPHRPTTSPPHQPISPPAHQPTSPPAHQPTSPPPITRPPSHTRALALVTSFCPSLSQHGQLRYQCSGCLCVRGTEDLIQPQDEPQCPICLDLVTVRLCEEGTSATRSTRSNPTDTTCPLKPQCCGTTYHLSCLQANQQHSSVSEAPRMPYMQEHEARSTSATGHARKFVLNSASPFRLVFVFLVIPRRNRTHAAFSEGCLDRNRPR